jgi:hypothetical protein
MVTLSDSPNPIFFCNFPPLCHLVSIDFLQYYMRRENLLALGFSSIAIKFLLRLDFWGR